MNKQSQKPDRIQMYTKNKTNMFREIKNVIKPSKLI